MFSLKHMQILKQYETSSGKDLQKDVEFISYLVHALPQEVAKYFIQYISIRIYYENSHFILEVKCNIISYTGKGASTHLANTLYQRAEQCFHLR